MMMYVEDDLFRFSVYGGCFCTAAAMLTIVDTTVVVFIIP